MIFFTDFQTTCSNYCLLNIKKYHLIPKLNKEIYFIDPSVLELKKNNEYSQIDLLHQIANKKLLPNQFISIDYPPDMNLELAHTFINKSITNNIKYKDNKQYICTIQYNFKDFKDFDYQFDYLKDKVNFNNKIIGLGNLCRIIFFKKNFNYVKKITGKIISEIKYLNWIHFYGLSYQLIQYIIPKLHKANNKCIISIDSTKWTRAIDSKLKWMYGFQCKKSNRNLYFLYYIHKIIEKAKIPVLY